MLDTRPANIFIIFISALTYVSCIKGTSTEQLLITDVEMFNSRVI